jgi:hypothetical protein
LILLNAGFYAVRAEAATADLYISPDGNDNWSGRYPRRNAKGTDGPLATLNRARDVIRSLKAGGKFSKPITVMLRNGNYFLSEPFTLQPNDSGSEQKPITYMAYPGEKPILNGGRRITGWKAAGGGRWSVEIPDVREGRWYFRQLFVNGSRRQRPRLPRQGSFAIAGPSVSSPSIQSPKVDGFRFRKGDILETWSNLNDVEVVVLQYWTEARLLINDVNSKTQTVSFTRSSWRPLTWSKGYFVENVFEALGEPGQWYLDRKTGRLTYWPLPGEDMSRAEVVAPVTPQLLRLEGELDNGNFVESVSFRGLTFSYSSAPLPPGGHAYPQAEVAVPAAIFAQGARYCVFENNEITRLGQWGLEFSRGCRDNRIVSNRIHDLGAGGIKIGYEKNPEEDKDETCCMTIADNLIYDGNKVYLGAPAVWIGQSGQNLIAHNEIRGAWQWGISAGWTWDYLPVSRARDNRIEFNHIHNLGNSELGTHGAIYCLGLSPGTVVRNNLIHHISGGGYGIILDQGCSGVLVENNLIHHTDGGFSSNFHCIGNIIINNIFALAKQDQIHRYGDDPPPGFELRNYNLFSRNIIYWKEGRLFKRDDWIDFAAVFDFNLYFKVGGEPIKFLKYTFKEWKAKGLDIHSMIADPFFVDPQGGNYNLKPSSPAFKLGFQQIDPSQAGIRPWKTGVDIGPASTSPGLGVRE